MKKTIEDLSEITFHKLTVIELSHIAKNNHAYWRCICECGNEKVIRGSDLKNGHTKSCGCINPRNGLKKHYFYSIYRSQVDRCNNKNNKNYHNYGGRGIQCLWTVKEACEWADNNPKPGEGYQLDRIDNNGHYCAENVRWVTIVDNNLNKRTTRNIESYEDTPATRYDFKKFCNSRGINFLEFEEEYSGEKNKNGNKKYYYKKVDI